MNAAKHTTTSAAAATTRNVTAIVLVVWTAGEKTPHVTLCLDEQATVEHARYMRDNNTARIAEESAARSTLINAGLAEAADQVRTTPKLTIQIKKLQGTRAVAFIKASTTLEAAQEDDRADAARISAAQSALIACI